MTRAARRTRPAAAAPEAARGAALDARGLLAELQGLVKRLEADIRERAAGTPEIRGRIEEAHRAASAAAPRRASRSGSTIR